MDGPRLPRQRVAVVDKLYRRFAARTYSPRLRASSEPLSSALHYRAGIPPPAAIHARTFASSTGIGSAPESSTTAWNARGS